jgi:hypothetical protein
MQDPLCQLYYPMRRECYWWSIVMLLRPIPIAIAFNARNRGNGLIFDVADWRVIVIFYLMVYSNVQATVKPFKMAHESWLDSVCVLVVMLTFVADIQQNLPTIGNTTFIVVVVVTGLVLLVASTLMAKHLTRKEIRYYIRLKFEYRVLSSDILVVLGLGSNSMVQHLGSTLLGE